jgi:hypothetical protein
MHRIVLLGNVLLNVFACFLAALLYMRVNKVGKHLHGFDDKCYRQRNNNNKIDEVFSVESSTFDVLAHMRGGVLPRSQLSQFCQRKNASNDLMLRTSSTAAA